MAFSSSPMPRWRTTWMACGLPFASTISLYRNRTLILGGASRVSELRIDRVDDLGSGDASAHAHNAASVAAAAARSNATTAAGAYAAAGSLAESGTSAGPLRGDRDLRGLRDAQVGMLLSGIFTAAGITTVG